MTVHRPNCRLSRAVAAETSFIKDSECITFPDNARNSKGCVALVKAIIAPAMMALTGSAQLGGLVADLGWGITEISYVWGGSI